LSSSGWVEVAARPGSPRKWRRLRRRRTAKTHQGPQIMLPEESGVRELNSPSVAESNASSTGNKSGKRCYVESSYDQKESIRELAALVRTASEATARAAELLYQWKAPEDAEIENLRAVTEELLLKNADIAQLASDGHFEMAMVKARALKLHCDAAASLRPIGKLRAILQTKALSGDPVSRLKPEPANEARDASGDPPAPPVNVN
jgi:hypothetical protein